MLLKQVTAYRLTNTPTVKKLRQALENARFTLPTDIAWYSGGFDTPQPFDSDLVFEAGDTIGIALRRAERILPANVIQDALNAAVLKIWQTECRFVKKKEKSVLRQDIIDTMLPKAFIRSTYIHAIIANGWLLVGTSSTVKAEWLLNRLRDALGGLEALLPQTEISPTEQMTNWLKQGQCGGNFELDDNCELRGMGVGAATIKVARQDWVSEEVAHHLDNGKTVHKLGLVWNERLAFTLTGNSALTRIRYFNPTLDEANAQGDDAHSIAVASQMIAAKDLTDCLNELGSLLGGFQKY